jgi:hypothetical protein
MFGLFGSKDKEQADNYARMIQAGVRKTDLQEELFLALKSGHLKTAGKIVELGTEAKTLAPYNVSTRAGWYNTGTHDGNENSQVGVDDWACISDRLRISRHSLMGKKVMLYSFRGNQIGLKDFETFFKAQRKPHFSIYDPLSYFIVARNAVAAEFLMKNGYPVNVGKDDPREVFCRSPLYQAIDEDAVLHFSLMLQHGAKPTDNILRYAVKSQKVAFVIALVEHGANVEAGKQELAELVQSEKLKQETFDDLAHALNLPVPGKEERTFALEPPATPAPPQPIRKSAGQPRPAKRAYPTHQVVLESPAADLTMQEIYDFRTLERITLFRKGEDVKSSLRQTFNDLGRNDRGLQKAIEVYQGRAPGFDPDSLFKKTITHKIV